MRVVLAGNGLAAAEVCDILFEAHADVLCISPPEHPAWQRDLAVHSRVWGISCIQPEDINAPEVLSSIGEPDLFLCVYYPQVFRGALLERIRGKALNFHPSLLPRHRGVSPLLFALMEGDEQTGITIHHIDEGIDTGNIILQRRFWIYPKDTGFRLHMRAAVVIKEMAAQFLPPILDGAPIPEGVPQEGEGSYHSLADYITELDPDWPEEKLERVTRALAPPLR